MTRNYAAEFFQSIALPPIHRDAFDSVNMNILRKNKAEVVLLPDSSALLNMKANELAWLFAGHRAYRVGSELMSVPKYALLLSFTVQKELLVHVNGFCGECGRRPNNPAMYKVPCVSLDKHEHTKLLHRSAVEKLAWFGIPSTGPSPGPVHVPVFVQTETEEQHLLDPIFSAGAGQIWWNNDVAIVLAGLYLSRVLVDRGIPVPICIASDDNLQRILSHINYTPSLNLVEAMQILG